jgi:hypothetical protein
MIGTTLNDYRFKGISIYCNRKETRFRKLMTLLFRLFNAIVG